MGERSSASGRETPERILAAAIAMLRTEPGARLSVRSVAARAGVGASTLRHHFPTQHALVAAAFARLYEEELPDDRMADESVPARERLLGELRDMVSQIGAGPSAREKWGALFEQFVGPSSTAAARHGYGFLADQVETRVQSWLAILVSEGSLAPGDNSRRAKFLLAVVDGLSIGRAFVADEPMLADENSVLETAVDAVLREQGVPAG